GSSVRERVLARLRDIGKPAVVAMLGRGVAVGTGGNVTTVATLEDAARAAIAILSGRPFNPAAGALPVGALPAVALLAGSPARVEDARRGLAPGQRAIRGLYTGGTLAHEASLIIADLAGGVSGNLAGGDGIHRVLDLGADEFTVGRAHPMLDPSARIE